jgi:hypothetical protein
LNGPGDGLDWFLRASLDYLLVDTCSNLGSIGNYRFFFEILCLFADGLWFFFVVVLSCFCVRKTIACIFFVEFELCLLFFFNRISHD